VLAHFADPVMSADGTPYRARACGGPMPDGLWEGWIEFVPIEGGASIRSPRETTQPNRTDTVYWTAGLTPVYLEGALERALELMREAAALDPFLAYDKGEASLRKELGALSTWHLVNIIVAYRLSDEPAAVLNRLPALMLIDLIVMDVRDHSVAGWSRSATTRAAAITCSPCHETGLTDAARSADKGGTTNR
jgi:hypothetical protein